MWRESPGYEKAHQNFACSLLLSASPALSTLSHMNNVRAIQKLNELELKMGVSGSWHDDFKHSAYIAVTGLPFDLTEGDIRIVFSQYGKVVDINLIRDKTTGKSRGFAFLAYEDQRSTVLAVDNFNGVNLLGRTLRVDHCKDYKPPKKEDKKDDERKGPDAPGAWQHDRYAEERPKDAGARQPTQRERETRNLSPPRRSAGADMSPPRRRESGRSSPARPAPAARDLSPLRGGGGVGGGERRAQTADLSPPRRRDRSPVRGGSDRRAEADLSPPRRRDRSADLSPPRRRGSPLRSRDRRDHSPARRSPSQRSSDRSPSRR